MEENTMLAFRDFYVNDTYYYWKLGFQTNSLLGPMFSIQEKNSRQDQDSKPAL